LLMKQPAHAKLDSCYVLEGKEHGAK